MSGHCKEIVYEIGNSPMNKILSKWNGLAWEEGSPLILKNVARYQPVREVMEGLKYEAVLDYSSDSVHC